MRDAAIAYIERGWKVIPIAPRSKVPLTTHGLLEASGAHDMIDAWWNRWPDANIGVVCGAQSGLVVLDIDPAKGGDDSFFALRQRVGELPETPEVITQSGGRHLYFRHPGHEVRPSASVLGDGLDIRGDGGYVVAPPSIGPTGRSYAWDLSSQDIRLAALPAALAGLVASPRQVTRSAVIPERIPEGQRESLLTSLAGSMRRRGSSARAIEAALAVENLRCEPPLSAAAVHRIAWSVGRYPVQARYGRGGFEL